MRLLGCRRSSIRVVALQGVALVGCASSSFSGSGPQKVAVPTASQAAQNNTAVSPPAAPDASDAAANGAIPHPAANGADACGSGGLTKVVLLTKVVANDKPDNFIDYRLSLTDCDGNFMPFTASKVGFDVGATVNNQGAINYTITDALVSSRTLSGVLENVEGSDLFGNVGSPYAHYETDQAINFAVQASSILVHIELGGLAMIPYNEPNSLQMNTYLAFGKAKPVTQVVTLDSQVSTWDMLVGSL